jgi:hypothetical protein
MTDLHADALRWKKNIEWRASPDPVEMNTMRINCMGVTSCIVPLPYPAKRSGAYLIRCECGMEIYVSTTGRLNDPRSVTVPCNVRESQKLDGGL